jgi:cobaltochelatase CobN
VRLIGGEAYWPYGVASLQDLARRRGIALAFLPADGRPDATLERFSTLDAATLHRLTALCDEGGAWPHRPRWRNWPGRRPARRAGHGSGQDPAMGVLRPRCGCDHKPRPGRTRFWSAFTAAI